MIYGVLALAVAGCGSKVKMNKPRGGFEVMREQMVDQQLEVPGRDIANERVLHAMRTTPRHELVPKDLKPMAYDDRPLPIGHGQTVSQPYIVAVMTEKLAPSRIWLA